jgi:hypothetical protein
METLAFAIGMILRLAIPLGLMAVLSVGLQRWDAMRSCA